MQCTSEAERVSRVGSAGIYDRPRMLAGASHNRHKRHKWARANSFTMWDRTPILFRPAGTESEFYPTNVKGQRRSPPPFRKCWLGRPDRACEFALRSAPFRAHAESAPPRTAG